MIDFMTVMKENSFSKSVGLLQKQPSWHTSYVTKEISETFVFGPNECCQRSCRLNSSDFILERNFISSPRIFDLKKSEMFVLRALSHFKLISSN